MTSRDVEAIVQSVIVERSLPLDLVSVTASPHGWELRVRLDTQNTLSVIVPDGPPAFVRAVLQGRLEAAI